MVTSQSMVGAFDQGDCIIVRKVNSSNEIKVGTDISFIRKSDGEAVTHLASLKLLDPASRSISPQPV